MLELSVTFGPESSILCGTTPARSGERKRIRMTRGRVVSALCTLVVLACATTGVAHAAGVTNAGDDLRTGWYPDQSSLTPQLVSGGTFGQLWSTVVDGQVYGQPLLANGTLLAVTENNKVYGLNPATGAAKWAAPLNLGTPWKAADIGCGDLTPNVGVTATPVIDAATNTAYMTHKTYASGTSGPAAYYMDAIDLATGMQKAGFPVRLSGTAQNASGQTFNATNELQRPGLLLLDGVVYAAFAGHCDITPYQGWVFGVSTAGVVKARWVANQTGNGAGIWQSGAGIASDGPGNMLLSTGNGGAPNSAILGSTPPANLGESVVRLKVQADGTLRATDFFAPFDAFSLDSWDADFASGGVTGLPAPTFGTAALPHLAVAVGKQGYVYLLNRDDLGGSRQGPSGSDRVVQRIGPYGGVWSRPGVWPGDGGYVYIPTASGGTTAAGSSGNLRVYKYGLDGAGKPALSLQATSTDAFGFSSSAPVITSDGATSGSALVWVVWTPGGSGVGAQLRAYDPVPVSGAPKLRWSAPIGTSAKFNPPGVGAGRVFVGTRDGHVLGFGSPVTPVLTGPATAFPTTTVGSTSQQTVTLTATDAITLSSLRSGNAQFAIGTPSKSLPATLAAGQTIDVPVTFAPTQTGPVGGTLTATTSSGRTADFALSGTGQAAAAQLEVTPPLVSFGGTAVGGHLSGSATFKNVGSAPLTINAVRLPSAPFGASGAPAVGSTIAPGASVTVTVTFDPTQAGTFEDAIGLDTTGGNDEVGLSGSAGSAGTLAIRSETNDYGTVVVGQRAARTFTVSNTGGVPVTITKSKPPTGGAFAATTTLAEGTTIAPGQTLTESVTFAPNGPGTLSGTWSINGDDSTGLHQVTFSGAGSVPAPAAPAWSLNGAATFPSAGVLKLTGLTRSVAGSSFFTTPLDSSRHLNVAFDVAIGGGGTSGADGQTLVLADAAVARPTALGASGGALGYGGIPGVAVAFDTYRGAVDPSANFVGIANGTNGAVDRLSWLATATAIPNLRTAVRHVVVDVDAGVMTVKIDGTQVLSQAVSLPPNVLLGFTGATGWVLDNHQVSNVVVSGDGGATPPPPPPPPDPATLTVTNAVSAPAGSGQAAQTFAYSGSCPSAFTTAAIGGGGSASPTLTGAVAGSSCSVAETAQSDANWSTTVSVNGGAPQRPAVSGGKLTVPTFALLAGANTVAFANTYTPPVSTTIPSPVLGGWQLNGTALISGSSLELTPASGTLKAGSAFWPRAVDPRTMRVDFDAFIGGGTGADGMTFAIQNAAATGASPTKLGVRGGGLGFSGISGVATALVEYKNAANPSNNFTGITDGPNAGSTDLMHWIATANLVPVLQNQTHHVTVTTGGGVLTIAVDGTQVLSRAVTLPASAYVGFTAGDGSLTNRHAVSNVVFS
jgi:hypothetical protein